MNKHYFADLHIHLGRTQTGKPVKITGSKNLTLANVLKESAERKGLDLIGIIDCHVPEILAELKQLIQEGKAFPLTGGGIRFEQLTLILGTEVEIYDHTCLGPLHVLCYLPTMESMLHFSQWMSHYQKNIQLSSQRSYVSARELQLKVKELAGLFVPAHVFTPFKSLYGKGVKQSLTEVFDPELIDAIELGLSSNTAMADQIDELRNYSFLSNSDAHSLAKIGREYQLLEVKEPDFTNLSLALREEQGQKIVANYGLDPKLGKYHQEVSQRLKELVSGQKQKISMSNPKARPRYIHQIPLEYIPQLGPKRLDLLIQHFGSEMNVLHLATRRELEELLPAQIAKMILQARTGESQIKAGGGGVYGKLAYE